MQFDIDMASVHSDLFVAVRNLLLSFEGVTETKKPRITTYSAAGGGVCHLRTMPHGVDIGFLKGTHIQDKYNALTGTGKKVRVLSIEKIDEDLIKYYVAQAVEINDGG